MPSLDRAALRKLGANSKRPITPFEARVYAATQAIPEGRVTTYGAMARALGSSPRAVGQALKRNPFAPLVPCHRVVSASRAMGGFNGGFGPKDPNVQRKKKILAGEGVGVRDHAVDDGAVLEGEALAEVLGAAAATARVAAELREVSESLHV